MDNWEGKPRFLDVSAAWSLVVSLAAFGHLSRRRDTQGRMGEEIATDVPRVKDPY